MKTMKRMAALMLALCMLIALPMAVGAEDTTPLTITAAGPNAWSSGENAKIKFTFSENVIDNPSTEADEAPYANISTVRGMVGIYHSAQDLYYYQLDSATGSFTKISTEDFTEKTRNTQWILQNFGRRGQGRNQLLGVLPESMTMPQVIKIYQAVKSEYPEARLVAVVRDMEKVSKNGFVDGIYASNDMSKKLPGMYSGTAEDWAEYRLLQELTGADLQKGALLVHFLNPVKNAMNGTYKLGLYKDGVLNADAGIWTVTPRNVRVYGDDKTTLVTDFADYDAVKAAMVAYPDHELRLTITSKNSGIDACLDDETDLAGRRLLANTTDGNYDAAYTVVSTQNETLRLVDAKFFNANKVIVTFNKPITSATEHYTGLSLYDSKTGTSMMAYKLSDDSTSYVLDTASNIKAGGGNVDGNGTTSWKLAQWDVEAWTSYNADGTQYLLTLKNNQTVAAIQEIVEGSTRDLRFRIQENANMGAGNGVVDTIWATADENDRLLSSVYDEKQDQAWCSVSGHIFTVAMNGETSYDSLDTALEMAKSGETVKLCDDVESDLVMVPAGVTLDLNGNKLTTNIMAAFGHVIDSQDGSAKLIASQDGAESIIHLQNNNPYMPLYDTDGYRFFSYTESELGSQMTTNNASIKFGIQFKFENAEAYDLLASEENAGQVIVQLVAVKEGKEQKFDYKISSNTLQSYAAAVANPEFINPAVTLTVSGIGALDSISGTPAFVSPTGMVYTGVVGSYSGAAE